MNLPMLLPAFGEVNDMVMNQHYYTQMSTYNLRTGKPMKNGCTIHTILEHNIMMSHHSMQLGSAREIGDTGVEDASSSMTVMFWNQHQ